MENPFAAAGLELTQLTAAEPQWMDLSGFDERAAWTGTIDTLHLKIPIRVEAAAYRGRPVYFQLIWPWTKPVRQEAYQGPELVFVVFSLVIAALIIGAIWLARYNWRNGRGDRKGAFRLALYIFTIIMLRWVLVGSHFPAIGELLIFFFLIVSQALLGAAVAWLAYIALEPLVRRRWPSVMISWKRLLDGQLRDPLVGRDVLLGIFFAVLQSIRFYIESYLELRLETGTYTFGVDQSILPDQLSVRSFLGGAIEYFWTEPLMAVGTLLFMLLLRVLTRRQWLAVGCYILLGTGLNMLAAGKNPLVIALLVGFVFAINAFVMVRLGLLAFAAYAIAFFGIGLPIAPNFSTWYSTYGLIGIGLVLLLAIYAFHTALGGQKVFSGKLLEE